MSGFLFSLFLIAAGGYTAYRLRFFCFLHPIGTIRAFAVRETKTDGAGYSPLRALAVALAGTLGVGNITGVAAAILLGGSGALFWMWISALCTMLIKYAEVYLAMLTREKQMIGGRIRYWADRCGISGICEAVRCGLRCSVFCALPRPFCKAILCRLRRRFPVSPMLLPYSQYRRR